VFHAGWPRLDYRDSTSAELARAHEAMRGDRDERARENAMYYIASGKEPWSEAEFYESGRTNVREYSSTSTRSANPRAMRVLETGCGIGRLTLYLASVSGRFAESTSLPRWIARARGNLGHLQTSAFMKQLGPTSRLFLRTSSISASPHRLPAHPESRSGRRLPAGGSPHAEGGGCSSSGCRASQSLIPIPGWAQASRRKR
jgi:hypothetical protein